MTIKSRIKVAERFSGLGESQTLAITAKANELKASGVDVLSFSAGEPDVSTYENIKKAAIAAIIDGKTKYTAVGGINELKDAIIEKFKSDNDLEYSRDEVIVSCGGKHSFFNLCQALINPGDEVIIPAPYWVSYPAIVELAGGVPVILEAGEEKGFKINSDDFQNTITDKTKMLILNSPSNPTGAVYSDDELKALAEVAVKNGVAVMSDEIYEKLSYIESSNDSPVKSIATVKSIASFNDQVPGIKDLTFIINGVSKAYAMTGWRIGYAAGNKDIIKAMSKYQSQSTSNPTSISQWASVEAISGDQSKVSEMREIFRERRDVIVRGLNTIDGINCLTPGGAFYVFPNVSSFYGKTCTDSSCQCSPIKNSADFASFLIDIAKVAVVPGGAFGAEDHIRMSFACSIEDINAGISRIKEAVAKLK